MLREEYVLEKIGIAASNDNCKGIIIVVGEFNFLFKLIAFDNGNPMKAVHDFITLDERNSLCVVLFKAKGVRRGILFYGW